jgi:hypothetical protein
MAVSALVVKGDKAELNALLNNTNVQADRYTVSSYNAFVVARENAETVLDDDDADQATVDAAKSELQAKYDALKPIADKTDLLAALEQAKAVSNEGYTEESWANFEQAIAYAQSVADSNDVEQETADEAVTLLTTAQGSLVEAKKASGCSSQVGSGLFSMVLLAGCVAFVTTKKRNGVEHK